MQYVGIDVHKRKSQICLREEDGSFVEQRIPTTREDLEAFFRPRRRCRILIESSTVAEWVAQALEGLGHEVIVADPSFVAMYGTRNRRIKTDKRDARALFDACSNGVYRVAHRCSQDQRRVRALHSIRELLVAQRTQLISLIGAMLTREGIVVRTGRSETFVDRVRELELPQDVGEQVSPLLELLDGLDPKIDGLDEKLAAVMANDPRVRRLTSIPSIAVITASAIVAAVDDVARFETAHKMEAYLGLVPSERSSGEKRAPGSITKTGSRQARCLLVQAGWRLMRSIDPEAQPLKEWALKIAARRGRKIAAVALARKLAGIMYAMLRDGKDYDVAAATSRRGRTYRLQAA